MFKGLITQITYGVSEITYGVFGITYGVFGITAAVLRTTADGFRFSVTRMPAQCTAAVRRADNPQQAVTDGRHRHRARHRTRHGMAGPRSGQLQNLFFTE